MKTKLYNLGATIGTLVMVWGVASWIEIVVKNDMGISSKSAFNMLGVIINIAERVFG